MPKDWTAEIVASGLRVRDFRIGLRSWRWTGSGKYCLRTNPPMPGAGIPKHQNSGLLSLTKGLFIVLAYIISSSPDVFIGDPVFSKKNLDSRSKT